MKERNYTLDFIKIIATTVIIFHHWQQGTGAVYQYINFYGGVFYFGWLVELFFIISGFLCYHWIKRLMNDVPSKTFILKKYVRLMPMVSISVIVEAMLRIYKSVKANEELGFDLWNLIQNMLGIQQGWVTNSKSINGPTWYISILLLCYVVFIIAVAIAKRLKTSPVYFFVAVILLGLAIDTYGISTAFLNKSASRGYVAFFVGILLGYIIFEYGEYKKMLEIVSISNLCLCLILAIVYSNFIRNNLYWVLVFMIYPSLIILAQSKLCFSIFKYSYLSVLGSISFHTYLWHESLAVVRGILINAGVNIDLSRFSTMIWYAIISWIVGAISYYVFERNLFKYISLLNKSR